jgi:hypothetical protein
MKGTVVGIIPKSKKDGGTFWNVVVESEEQPGKSFGYNCFDSAIVGMDGKAIEFTSSPPKVGTTPILRLAGAMKEPFGGRPAPTTYPTATSLAPPSARKEGRNESFAASYAKDITVAFLGKTGTELGYDTVKVDALLDHYFSYFMKKLSGEEVTPF